MPQQPSVTFYNFNPDILSQAILAKDWDRCWGYLIQLIESFSVKKNMSFNVALQASMSDDELKSYLENFGSLMAELLVSLLQDKNVKIPFEIFYRLIYLHETIHGFFAFAGLSNTDETVSQFLGDSKSSLGADTQKRLLLFLSLDSDLDILSILKRIDSKFRSIAVASYLGQIKNHRKAAYYNKVNLLQCEKDIHKLCYNLSNPALVSTTVSSLISCYFTCSYLNVENRHNIKRTINRGIEQYIRKKTSAKQSAAWVVPSFIDEINKNLIKPKLLIVLETFDHGHAMQRSWALWIQSLQSSFHVVLALHKKTCPSYLMEEYDVISFDYIEDFIFYSKAYKPDMLILPSVGMSFWGIAASNMRLAPVQMMALGHPATSMSKQIDFVYGQSHLYDERAFPDDCYICDDSPYKFLPRLSKEDLSSLSRHYAPLKSGEALRVSVIGTELKLSYPFLRLLQEIEESAEFDIEFHFNLGSSGLDSFLFERDLKESFKHVVYNGFQPYEDFLSSIAKTDIILNPFPFGHTNTLIDALLLGKPIISLSGIEPSARTEKYILNLTGLDQQFETHSLDDYKAKFFELAESIRQGHSTFYDSSAVYDILYTQDQNREIDYGKHVRWIYDHAKEMKRSNQKLFTIADDC